MNVCILSGRVWKNATVKGTEPKTLTFILETRNMLAIDATGIRAMEDLHGRLAGSGTRFIVSGLHKQPLFALTQSGLLDRLGEDNLCGTLEEALEQARGPATS